MNIFPTSVDSSLPDDPSSASQRPVLSGDEQQQEDDGASKFDGSPPTFLSESDPPPSAHDDPVPGTTGLGKTHYKETNPNLDKSELVVSKPLFCYSPKPHRPPDTVFEINKHVSQSYFDLMEKFSGLMVMVHEELAKKPELIKPFAVYLMGIACNMQLGTGSSLGEVKIKDSKDWTEVFDKLSDMRAWDCLNYSLLRKMINEYLENSDAYARLSGLIQSYDREVQVFLQSTLLLDFLDVYKELFAGDSDYNKGCGLLKAKLKGDLATMTLAGFRAKEAYLKCHFRLKNYVLRLAVANEGCVILYWYLPHCLVAHIQETCKELQPDFGQAGVIELCIDDYVLYQASNIEDITENEDAEPASDVMSHYDELLAESIKNPREFWSRMAAKTLLWDEPFTKAKVLEHCNMAEGKIHWFDGKLNASVNCLDRHAESAPNKVAIIWEKNDGTCERISYQKLLEMTCQIAHVLTKKQVKKGDVVLIYMASSPTAVAAMLACTRIGAVHSVAYAVLKSNELEARIKDASPRCIITSDVAMIGERTYSLKSNVDRALSSINLRSKPKLESRCCSTKSLDHLSAVQLAPPSPALLLQRSISSGASSGLDEEESYDVVVKKKSTPRFTVLVSSRSESHTLEECDFKLEEEMAKCPTTFPPVSVDAEQTMFIMYTSGTTPATTPTGIKHCTAGYLLYVALTHQYVFDYKVGDVFGCMAALGWITGHSYVVYGPLCNGATTVLFEGTATYPNSDRYWKAISDHKINQFYVTPYVISELMRDPSTNYRDLHDLSSLKTIATVGEPLSSHVLNWFLQNIGHDGCKFVDTWWQTEMGGIALIVDHHDLKLPEGNFPAKPFFGVEPVIIDPKLKGKIEDNMPEPGYLCLRKPLPGMGRGVTDLCKKNFVEMYFPYKGQGFFTQDLALKLENGGYRVTGRLNNAIRIQGVWLDVASIEDQMNKSDHRIVKSTLVGIPDKNVNTEKYEYEGACIFLECSSDDPTVRDEVTRKVMKTVTESNLLPPETANGLFPGVIVLYVSNWLLTHSGKTIITLYQNMMDLITQLWLCSPSETPFLKFCKHYLEVSSPLI